MYNVFRYQNKKIVLLALKILRTIGADFRVDEKEQTEQFTFQVAQNSFQHLDFDGSLQPLFIT